MTSKHILLIGSGGHDPSIVIVNSFLSKFRNVEVSILDTTDLGSSVHFSCAFSNAERCEVSLQEGHSQIMLSNVHAVWNRRWHEPKVIQGLQQENCIQAYALENWKSLFYGASLCSGTVWVNDPNKQSTAAHKLYQLEIAQGVGFNIPRTMVTSDPSTATQFIEEVGEVIGKSLATLFKAPATKTVPLTRKHRETIELLRYAPVIFQEHVKVDRDIRVIVIGSICYCGEVETAKGNDPVDWRSDFNNPWKQHLLPEAMTQACIRLTSLLGLRYGAIDLRLTPSGEYVFFEINPAGQFLFLEVWTNMPIAASIADYLVSVENGAI